MGDIKDIIEAIEARMVVLGFTQTEVLFNFEEIPDSIIHQAFRIDSPIPVENPYYSGNISNPQKNIPIWIAYKAYRKSRTAMKTAEDDRETIEVDLINHSSITGLGTDPLLTLSDESTAKEVEGYIVSNLVFTANYIRDISS